MGITSDDWVARATVAESKQDSIRCIEKAEQTAKSTWELNNLLDAMLSNDIGTLEQLQRIARKTLESASNEPEVWAFRNVATAMLQIHNDPLLARDALEKGVAAYTNNEEDEDRGGGLGCNLTLLARGFAETLQDKERAAECLEILRERATQKRNVDDLCDVASGYALYIGDIDSARQVLVAAEQVSTTERVAWSLANVWHDLGDNDRAESLLRRHLERCRTSDDAIYISNAFESHENLEDCYEAMEVAKKLAKTTDDWLDIAQAYHLLAHDTYVREALENSKQLADERSVFRVARGYRLWASDPEEADKIAPRGVRPSDLRETKRNLQGFTASADALFDHLRERLTNEKVDVIAGADYGQDFDQHRAAIVDIRDSGLVPFQLPWEPREVLELTRWGCNASIDTVTQAFCVCVLLICDADTENNVPILVDCGRCLGDEAVVLAELFLVWMIEVCEEDDSPDVFSYLGLALLHASRDVNDPRIEAIADDVEEMAADEDSFFDGGMQSMFDYCTSRELWVELMTDLWQANSEQNPTLGRLAKLCGIS